MDAKQKELRQVSRKYRRLKRREKQVQHGSRSALRIALVLLCALAVLAVRIAAIPKREAGLPDALRVCFLDVGQGDAALIRTPEHAVLIDAGDYEQSYSVVQMLKALGVSRLDAAICSHPHADHIGGMSAVLEQIGADVLYLPDMPEQLVPTDYPFTVLLDTAEKTGTALRSPACHDTVVLGSTVLEFLCTDNSGFDDLNNCSLGCRVTCGDVSFFLAGDLEKDAEAAFLDAGLIEPVSVLKVSHHGSNSSSSEPFLQAAKPEYAVISVGAMNDYGHPAEKLLDRLAAHGCTVYRTDLDGTVVFATDGRAIRPVPHWDFGF